jgi:hypothetical protein
MHPERTMDPKGVASRAALALGMILCAVLPLRAAADALGDLQPRFSAAVRGTTFAQTAAPLRPVLLRWDFRPRRLVLYALEQAEEQVTTQRMAGRSRTFRRISSGGGALVVYSRGGGLSTEVRLQDVDLETTLHVGGETQSANARLPVQITSGLTEAGRIERRSGAPAISAVDNLVSTLFVLPGAALAVGESEEVPLRLGAAVQWGQRPGQMAVYPLTVEGSARVTLAGYERVEACDCARLDITFDLASRESPKGFPGAARVVVRGSARSWFDSRARRMVAGDLAMQLGIDVRAPEPAAGAAQHEAGMLVVTDTHTRVRLGR